MGKVSRSIFAESAASEAIFSKQGKVQKRIPNFETTVVETSENVLVFPPENDSQNTDLPDQFDHVPDDSQEHENKTIRPARFSSVMVGFIIIITFCWSIYSLFFSTKNDTLNEIEASELSISMPDVNQSRISQLKLLAENLMTNSTLSEENINLFLDNWNRLSEDEVSNIVKKAWYQKLEIHVKKQLSEHGSLDSVQTEQHHNSNQSLLTLALVMGISEQTDENPSPTHNNSSYDKLLAELTSDLKQADKTSKAATHTQESESTLYAKLKQKFAQKPIKQYAKIAKSKANTYTYKKLLKAEKNVSSKTALVSKQDIDSVITSYKKAYQNGDINLMAKLFGASDKNSVEFNKVKIHFDSTFKNTVNRSVNIYDIKTHQLGDNIQVESKFNASVDFKNGKGTQYTVAKMKLLVTRKYNQVMINQLNITDRKVNVVTNNRQQLSRSNGKLSAADNKKVVLPTAAELQDITTQLVTSYETGDLSQFTSLFANDVKTNDRIDLEGVKQDYSQLFSTTSDRQMFIQNLKWSNDAIGAKGTGDLEVIILSDEGKTVYSMEGKIQIVAQKIDREVKITHLYHIERAK